MEYKKIENEIDNLLHNGVLNPYEKKLLRKVKRKFCVEHRQKLLYVALIGFKDCVIRKFEEEIENRGKAIRRLAICNLLSGVAVILTIAAYFLK